MNNEELSLALQIINGVRERCGLTPLSEIPKGIAPDSDKELGKSCPLARAIPDTVIAVEYVRTPNLQTAEALSLSFREPIQIFVEFPGEFVIDLPQALADFVAHYDHDELPQFIEKPKKLIDDDITSTIVGFAAQPQKSAS